jgi:hypothetical protein
LDFKLDFVVTEPDYENGDAADVRMPVGRPSKSRSRLRTHDGRSERQTEPNERGNAGKVGSQDRVQPSQDGRLVDGNEEGSKRGDGLPTDDGLPRNDGGLPKQ